MQVDQGPTKHNFGMRSKPGQYGNAPEATGAAEIGYVSHRGEISHLPVLERGYSLELPDGSIRSRLPL